MTTQRDLPPLSREELEALGAIAQLGAPKASIGLRFILGAWATSLFIVVSALPALALGAARVLGLEDLIATLEGIDTLRAGIYLFGGAQELLWRSLLIIVLALSFAFTHTLNRGTRGAAFLLTGYLTATLALDLFAVGASSLSLIPQVALFAAMGKLSLIVTLMAFTRRYETLFNSTLRPAQRGRLSSVLQAAWGRRPIDELFLGRLHLALLIGLFYFFRLGFPEASFYENSGLDPSRTAGITTARALWVPFWIGLLSFCWLRRRWEREAFTAFALVTTLNMFFDIPFFFLAQSTSVPAVLFPALLGRSLVVLLAWSMVRNVGHLPLDRTFFSLAYLRRRKALRAGSFLSGERQG
ncbi:MAG: hypothetical protein ACO2YP_00650 [Pseudomonadales bacterium]